MDQCWGAYLSWHFLLLFSSLCLLYLPQILLKMLDHYSIANKWFYSFLKNKSQFVEI